jgi:hypothetical protein
MATGPFICDFPISAPAGPLVLFVVLFIEQMGLPLPAIPILLAWRARNSRVSFIAKFSALQIQPVRDYARIFVNGKARQKLEIS